MRNVIDRGQTNIDETMLLPYGKSHQPHKQKNASHFHEGV